MVWLEMNDWKMLGSFQMPPESLKLVSNKIYLVKEWKNNIQGEGAGGEGKKKKGKGKTGEGQRGMTFPSFWFLTFP